MRSSVERKQFFRKWRNVPISYTILLCAVRERFQVAIRKNEQQEYIFFIIGFERSKFSTDNSPFSKAATVSSTSSSSERLMRSSGVRRLSLLLPVEPSGELLCLRRASCSNGKSYLPFSMLQVLMEEIYYFREFTPHVSSFWSIGNFF